MIAQLEVLFLFGTHHLYRTNTCVFTIYRFVCLKNHETNFCLFNGKERKRNEGSNGSDNVCCL